LIKSEIKNDEDKAKSATKTEVREFVCRLIAKISDKDSKPPDWLVAMFFV